MLYRLAFNHFRTETEAQEFYDLWNRQQSPYMRRKHPAHFTPCKVGDESLFVAWYYA